MLGILGRGAAHLSRRKGPKARLFRSVPGTRLATLQLVNIPPLRLLLCAAGAALAQQLPALAQTASAVPPADLARALALVGDAAVRLAPAGARIQVLPGVLDARLQLAPCGRADAYLPTGVPAWGRTRVGLRCADGSARWNVLMPVTVQVWAPAAVARVALPAGAALADSPMQLAEIDWAAASSPAFANTDLLSGRQLARPVAAGQAVRQADLLPRQWFAAGDTVKIVATGAGFAIYSEGVALGSGQDGHPVRVRMPGDRYVVGRAVAQRQVEVGP